MVKKSQNRSKRSNATLIIAMSALFIATATFVYSAYTHQMTRMWVESTMENDMKEWSNHERYKFCYDNGVKPCTDDAIQRFNGQQSNKDNMFNF